MPKSKNTDPATALDRFARDLNRVLLHGARAYVTGNGYKPAMLATGQQIPADVPTQGDMQFEFEVAGKMRSVKVLNADAQYSDQTMRSAVSEKNEAKYLSLQLDPKIPTWVFSQREFSLPEKPVPEEVAKLTASAQTVLRLPAGALHEVQRVGHKCDVSLWKLKSDPKTGQQTGDPLSQNWKPALLLRFSLQVPKDPNARLTRQEKADGLVLELAGTPQGDRYYLDQLGLLPGNNVNDAPAVKDVRFIFEADADEREEVTDWTVARTNLTQEARPQMNLLATTTATEFPYVATGDDLAEKQDTLRLLQMASITNSGGYYVRAKVGKLPKTLIVCVLLKPESASHDFSIPLPRAANAIAYPDAGLTPNEVRFEEPECVHVTPFVPPGHVAFGWTRQEPETKKDDEERFGYGTISLVAYDAVDGAGKPVESSDSCIAISPLRELQATTAGSETGGMKETASAALRMLTPYQAAAQQALGRKPRGLALPPQRYYRASFSCYDALRESPYAPLAYASRRKVTFSPEFRDVFGNRFKPQKFTNPPFPAKLFYTDALIAPAEWPGMKFSMYPTVIGTDPALALEIAYTPLPASEPKTTGTVGVTVDIRTVKGTGTAFNAYDVGKYLRVAGDSVAYAITNVDDQKQELTLAESFGGATNAHAKFEVFAEVDRDARYRRLLEILAQLEGAKADVKLQVLAMPLIPGETDILSNVTDWLRTDVIPLEDSSKLRGDLPPQPCPLPKLRCTPFTLVAPSRFEPHLRIVRTDKSLQPQGTDWPSDGTLKAAIEAQIAEATSPVRLAEDVVFNISQTGSDGDSEFRNVAKKFQTALASHYNSQVGYLRDQFNEHQLWFLPDTSFPIAASGKDWSYATARPLSQKIGTGEVLLPDFSEKPSTAPNPNWEGYALRRQNIGEQDFDELCRTAFRLIEREAFKPAVVTDRTMADLAKSCLQTKDQVARTLASWTDVDPGFLVPLFEASSEFEPKAITRTGEDAFLQNLNGFYRVDTFMQLPLDRAADGKYFATLQGKVESPFAPPLHAAADDPTLRLPDFSDVLLKGDECKVTVLYDVPAGIEDPNSDLVPVIPLNRSFKVTITHVQLREGFAKNASKASTLAEKTGFARGPWLTLADEAEFELEWQGIGKRVPAAIRKFPLPPAKIQSVVNPLELPGGGVITAKNVTDLVKWGWQVNFAAEGLSTDTIHTVIRYNEEESPDKLMHLAVNAAFPGSLLECLLAMSLLEDHWNALEKDAERLPLLEKLFAAFRDLLSQSKAAQLSIAQRPTDTFDLTFSSGNATPKVSNKHFKVMKGEPVVTGTNAPPLKEIQMLAKATAAKNEACLLAPAAASPGPVWNFRPSLRLTRNEAIDDEKLNPKLIYECVTVEAPLPTRASNLWTPPTFQPFTYRRAQGQSLRDALVDFFVGLFNGAPLDEFAVEVNVALHCGREAQTIQTAFSLIPLDLMPSEPADPHDDPAAVQLAHRVYSKIILLLGEESGTVPCPPEVDSGFVRLDVKVSDAERNNVEPKLKVGRTRLEIPGIDFKLDPPKTRAGEKRKPPAARGNAKKQTTVRPQKQKRK